MKKIILAFDGMHFPESSLDFARKLNYKSPILLTGAFLPQVDYINLWSYSGGGMAGATFIPLLEDEDAEAVSNNIKDFESWCRNNEVRYTVHKNYFDLAIPALKKETRFADLLILSSEIFYSQAGSRSPNEYLKEVLREVECPVVVVPENFDFPKHNIISYDGSESSVYAIKQFAYLFPELAKNPTLLVYANEKESAVPDEADIRELLELHYPQSELNILAADSREYFSTWISEKKGSILISGAFGRSGISMLLKKSFVTEILEDHSIPVFIAHK